MMLGSARTCLAPCYQGRWQLFATAAAAAPQIAFSRAEWEDAKPYSEIPGPKALPVVGNAWRFLPVIGDFSKVKMKHLGAYWYQKYGPIMKLGGMPGRPDMIFLTDATEVEHMFRNEGPWPMRDAADSLAYYFEKIRKNRLDSLVTSQGKDWQTFRTAVNQVMMQPRNAKMYVRPIEDVSEDFLKKVMKLRDGNNQLPANFKEELERWALESIAYVALDTRVGALEDSSTDSESSRVVRCVGEIFHGLYELDVRPSVWKFISTPALRKFIASLEEFTEISSNYVNQAMERLKSLPAEGRESREYSVLERLLLANDDPGKGVSMALDMILAGVDTTSAASAAFMYQLATHPDKQRLLHEELDRVIPDPRQPLTKDTLEQLKYLRACIKETMRVNPVIPNNSRSTTKDLVIGGYRVPSGTRVVVNSQLLSMDEAVVPRAKEFLPERWLPGGESLKPINAFAYLPFGFGPRKCVGKRFADLEMEVLLSKLFRKASVEWHYPPAETEMEIFLTYKVPLKFTVTERI